MKTVRIRLVILIGVLSAQLTYADSTCAWARAIRGVTRTYDPFELELVCEESGRLVATANYIDYQIPYLDRPHRLPATIKGVRTSDGRFWPEVKAEVSNEIEKNWKPLGAHKMPGDASKVTFRANDPNEWLRVDLEPFRVMIGKFKYGRVTLTSGERAIFVLNNLLPPTGSSGYWCENLLPRIAPFDTPPFVVLAFESPTGKDVLAACGYGDKDATSPTLIEGTRTPPGTTAPSITGEPEFWPSVTAQVAVAYNREWTNIPAPSLPGEPGTLSIAPKTVAADLYVNLNKFRPFVGKFRYGRLLLPSGKGAIFELRELLPVENDM